MTMKTREAKLVVLLLGFLSGNLFGTILSFLRKFLIWDVLIISILVLAGEIISYIIYSEKKTNEAFFFFKPTHVLGRAPTCPAGAWQARGTIPFHKGAKRGTGADGFATNLFKGNLNPKNKKSTRLISFGGKAAGSFLKKKKLENPEDLLLSYPNPPFKGVRARMSAKAGGFATKIKSNAPKVNCLLSQTNETRKSIRFKMTYFNFFKIGVMIGFFIDAFKVGS